MLLAFFANARPQLMVQHLTSVVSIGLGPRAATDLTLARNACVALQRLNGASSASSAVGAPAASGVQAHPSTMLAAATLSTIYKMLRAVVLNPIVSQNWYPAAEQAIGALFALHPEPEVFIGALIKEMAQKALSSNNSSSNNSESAKERKGDEDEEDAEMDAESKGDDASSVGSADGKQAARCGNAENLARALFVLGHSAIKVLVQLENVEKDIKRLKNKTKKPTGSTDCVHNSQLAA